ncbi:MAG: YlbF family regulator [Thermacetogeniaceae bacterium]
MNVYDTAHALARALRDCEEYRALKEAKDRLEADPVNKEMLLEFRRRQWEIEADQALGKEVDEEKLKRVRQLGELVNNNPTLREYLAAEFRFARLMRDIQKILADALSEWSELASEFLKI